MVTSFSTLGVSKQAGSTLKRKGDDMPDTCGSKRRKTAQGPLKDPSQAPEGKGPSFKYTEVITKFYRSPRDPDFEAGEQGIGLHDPTTRSDSSERLSGQ